MKKTNSIVVHRDAPEITARKLSEDLRAMVQCRSHCRKILTLCDRAIKLLEKQLTLTSRT